MARPRKFPLAVAVAAAVALTCLLQFLCYRLDNKYTLPRPAAQGGVIHLDMAWYQENPFFYLVDQWDFYADKLLTPDVIADHTPDDCFYIGRYGGFDRGDRSRPSDGCGTYQMVIHTDDVPRVYALELDDVYTRWRLWVNGDLLQSAGYPDSPATAQEGPIVTFTAAGRIDLVIAVESDGSGFYSGMVYPPALGSPDAVSRTASLRLLLHAAACAVALLIGLLCLLVAAGYRFSRPYAALSLLCLCFCGATAWPIYQALGLPSGWQLVERVCYYGGFVSLLYVQGRVCRLPRRLYLPACAVGALICCAVALRPLLPLSAAGAGLLWSGLLSGYKWLTALWLLGTSAWAAKRGARYSRALLLGNCAFAAALVMDRLLPMREPVLLGWSVEIAGGLWVLLLAGVICYDAILVYRERAELENRHSLSQVQLAAQMEHARLQQSYIRRTRESLHESRSHLTLLRYYLDTGSLDKLRSYLNQLTTRDDGLDAGEHTGNSLVDAILTIQLSRAEALDAYVEREFDPLPDPLPLADEDLTSLLMNLTDNALEALERLPDPDDRWLRLSIEITPAGLVLTCENAALPRTGLSTGKADKRAHGFGLTIMAATAAKYGGTASFQPLEDCFLSTITLHLPVTDHFSTIQG